MTIEQAKARMEAMQKRIPDVAREAVREGAEAAVDALRATSPQDTGRLATSWRVDDTARGAAIENTAPYASYVDGIDVPRAVQDAGIPARIQRRINDLVG